MALTKFHHHFSSHLVLCPFSNYYPYPTHLFHSLIVQESGGVAIIIPLLKARKFPSKVTSFHPISFTSCVVKLLKRILADPLYYITETKNLSSHFQASFHEGQSCEYQITWIVQAIEDGFQQCPMQSFMLPLLDFSKAYDRLWGEKLLLHMLHTDIPPNFII